MLAGTAGTAAITEDLGSAGKDTSYGYGLLNANLAVLGALDLASNSAAPQPALVLSSTTLDFGAALDTLPLAATNAGRGTLTVSSMTANQPWISISPGAAGNNTVTVDRTGLPAGVYSGVITVTSNGGTATVSVQATVASQVTVVGGDVGRVYVLLVDPTTYNVVANVDATPDDGYAFTLTGVPPGDYYLVAGTDLDDNLVINDDGEAYGAYPLSTDLSVIHVTKSGGGYDFALHFQYDANAAMFGVGPSASSKRHFGRPAPR